MGLRYTFTEPPRSLLEMSSAWGRYLISELSPIYYHRATLKIRSPFLLPAELAGGGRLLEITAQERGEGKSSDKEDVGRHHEADSPLGMGCFVALCTRRASKVGSLIW